MCTHVAKLTDSDHDVYFPRFNHDGSRLVYFRAVAGGPHRTCAALMMVWEILGGPYIHMSLLPPSPPPSLPPLPPSLPSSLPSSQMDWSTKDVTTVVEVVSRPKCNDIPHCSSPFSLPFPSYLSLSLPLPLPLPSPPSSSSCHVSRLIQLVVS